jgi:Bacterial regulatory proteins, lacI family
MVIIALESHRYEAGDEVWPSLDRIALLAGVGRATATRMLNDHEDWG